MFQISPRRDRYKCKEIPKSSRLELLEKLLVNNFALSDAEDSTSWSLNRGGIADLPLLGILGNLPKFSRAKVMGSDGLFCFSSICKFGTFKSPFATTASLSELYDRFKRFVLLVQKKKVISMNRVSSTSS